MAQTPKRSTLKATTHTRIPTVDGEFQLYHYQQDDKEHLALVMGDVRHKENVLVRIHSECFTGDVLGSTRCDCGDQLQQAIAMIAQAGEGVLVYLRQEGRGIGLLAKLQAYNLQDQGYDTVDANLMLGHQADQRDYAVAAQILADLEVNSLQLLTNNPSKINSLRALDVTVTRRVPHYGITHPDNEYYLQTKFARMAHIPPQDSQVPEANPIINLIQQQLAQGTRHNRPHVTLSYAQSLDGSITLRQGQPTPISNKQAMRITHQLRTMHNGILVGIGTVLADDPQLTVRLASGESPRPIILDSHLRTPLQARLWQYPKAPLIFTSEQAPAERRQALSRAGAQIISLAHNADGLNLAEMLEALMAQSISNVFIEGGGTVITNFIKQRLIDYFVLTVAPMMLGGFHAVQTLSHNGHQPIPRLQNVHYKSVGDNLLVMGAPQWPE